jgi:transposase
VVPPPSDDDDHDCGWKTYAREQERELANLTERLAALERLIHGKKSEKRKAVKLPPPLPKEPVTRTEQQAKRDALAELRASRMETEVEKVPVAADERRCKCGSSDLREVGDGKPSTVIVYVPGHFRRHIYLRQTLSCRCGCIITAKAPLRVGEKTRYAPSFLAHLCVSKCSDTIPQHRLEKEYRRLGIPITRSTMNALLHRAAKELRPLYAAACALVPAAMTVHADETSVRQANLGKKAFMWDFVTPELTVYRYAESRSGEVAKDVLGDSTGTLIVDQYTGYNQVTKPGGRTRAGCLAHARRKLFEQREHAGIDDALELISQIYQIERDAKQAGVHGTEAHLELRRSKSRPLFARLLWWGRGQRGRHEPRSGIGRAVSYLMKNRKALAVFLGDVSVAPDNNKAEAALRRIALGRSNYLFFHDQQSGHNHAVLYTLVTSAERHGLNPTTYLADVLVRVQTHPQSRIDELLPHRYRPPSG